MDSSDTCIVYDMVGYVNHIHIHDIHDMVGYDMGADTYSWQITSLPL